MSYQIGRDAVDGYVWLDDPSLVLSGGASHARDASEDDPPYEPPRLPLGFTRPRTDREPLLWDGDQA